MFCTYTEGDLNSDKTEAENRWKATKITQGSEDERIELIITGNRDKEQILNTFKRKN